MENTEVYVLDSSFFIKTQHHHPIDIFPGVWKNLEKLGGDGRLIIPEEVKNELTVKDDVCSEFVERNSKSILEMTPNEISKVVKLQSQFTYLRELDKQYYGDPWVIAAAWCGGAQKTLCQDIKVVVTQESPSAHCNPSLKKLTTHKCPSRKIPDICEHLGIECLNDLDLFRKEGWKFDND